MKFDRLKLAGFKSFCDPVEFKIEPGLTGIVGPNGCGKSNLVEAMRWVMGENSYKNMRASGMEDVIFAGSSRRPSRNIAEVGLVLDNSDRRAPAAFNDSDTLEVVRRIERDKGSSYKINGREVRARDVQLLFADASTGARSPSMVRQGQIGEIIAAKPSARRLVLEEAAGISGLHSRRHEAELRLKAAEENLARVDDVLKTVEAQVESLRRQARQSQRYKGLGAEIRRAEALSKLIAWRAADAEAAGAETAFAGLTGDVVERTRLQAETARAQAMFAADLPALRDAEARAGAALHRLVAARDMLAGEEKRAEARAHELRRRIEQMASDIAREQSLVSDAAQAIERLDAESGTLASQEDPEDARIEAAEREAEAAGTLAEAEQALAAAQHAAADFTARRNALGATLDEEIKRWRRFEDELAGLRREREALPGAQDDETAFDDAAAALEELMEQLAEAEAVALEAEETHSAAREADAHARPPLTEAERLAQRLETEARTLEKLLGSGAAAQHPPVLEEIVADRGYEMALGAALGDDLDASTVEGAPALWAGSDGQGDATLPAGVQNLATHIRAPAQLQRRLRQIGVVTREQGVALAATLQAGQRLVSREGDLWRWDGFRAAAEAPTPAARRLVEKNRLGDLIVEAEAARHAAEARREQAARAANALRDAAAFEGDARRRAREARIAADSAREKVSVTERRRAQTRTKLAALDEGLARATVSRDEAVERRNAAGAALQALPAGETLTTELDRARSAAGEARARHADHQVFARNLAHELESRAHRRRAVEDERRSWSERRAKSEAHIGEISERRGGVEDEMETLDDAPAQFALQRRSLMSELGQAEAAQKAAVDERVAAEAKLGDADRAARGALEAMSDSREKRAAAESRVEAARRRREDLKALILTELETDPHGLHELAVVKVDETLPAADLIERRLEQLKVERERLGAVNLRADEELEEIEGGRAKMAAEQADLSEAIKRLRSAISSLNAEGRERLLAAFEVVNGHFGELFMTLFEGGKAELQLVESDDPLDAGLELLAQPPGKKPQTLTLLSGGEQALTAMALIFAVFLTNPSPICVLDEIDAPLDDYNVERFCDLLEAMRKRSDTRFVTITHNPVTMARMDRLFGVTMPERGVSQIVSVDLATAESFLEAG